MGTYRCLFCGVTYQTNRRIMTCAVCGKTTASGWLQKEESSVPEPAQHLLSIPPAQECKNETKDETGRRHAERATPAGQEEGVASAAKQRATLID